MAIYRVKETVSVIFPGTEQPIALRRGDPYDGNEPLRKAYPWAFELDSEQPDGVGQSRRNRRSVEQATAAPGEVRG